MKIWCPHCSDFSSVKVLPTKPSELLNSFGLDLNHARRAHSDFKEVTWYERTNDCPKCGNKFNTVELEAELLAELIGHRRTLASIQALIVQNKRKR